MARTLLDNASWDFDSNCFVCEPKNSRGLGVPFYLDGDAGRVVAEFTPETWHSGAPSFAHGGVSMALLDEGMAWAAIALAQRLAITRRAETTFSRPVRVGQAHTVSCWVESLEGQRLVARGEILDVKGRACVEVRAEFHAMTKEEAEAAVGGRSEKAEGLVADGGPVNRSGGPGVELAADTAPAPRH